MSSTSEAALNKTKRKEKERRTDKEAFQPHVADGKEKEEKQFAVHVTQSKKILTRTTLVYVFSILKIPVLWQFSRCYLKTADLTCRMSAVSAPRHQLGVVTPLLPRASSPVPIFFDGLEGYTNFGDVKLISSFCFVLRKYIYINIDIE